MVDCVKKEKNAVKSQKVIFLKITETAQQSSSTEAAYSENSLLYSFNFNGGLYNRRNGFCLQQTPSPEGKHFLWLIVTLHHKTNKKSHGPVLCYG